MSYQVLARKWRPIKFQEVIGQSHVTKSLQNVIMRDKVGQAYIFTGTRGVGKTTVARIFAKALRCLNRSSDGNPCGQCASCMDFDTGSSMNVIEIDGASNNGVDHIRELISNVQYVPTIGKYRIYIIDEVHMVTTQAFNALLKTLEEPPKHVIFIFATTEPEKLLHTVLSRCQRFDFRHVATSELVTHIKRIAQKEGINFEQERLMEQIALQGNGSVRDTLSLLDQVLSFADGSTISEKTVMISLGLAGPSAIKGLVSSMLAGDVQACSGQYKRLIAENVAVKNIAVSLLDYLFEIIEKIDDEKALYQSGYLQEGILEDISGQELFWIYETIAKDASWVLESIAPEKVFDILLQKVCLRRSLLASKKKIVPSKKPELPAKNWESFVKNLHQNAPTTASNLDQGNILNKPDFAAPSIFVELGFDFAAQVFMEYLQDKEVRERLVGYIASYFGKDAQKIELKMTLLNEQQKKELQFVSRIELENQRQRQEVVREKEKLLSDPLIKEAEQLFNSKVDKVIIDKK